MRMTLILAITLAGCGSPEDRLSDEHAAAEQNQKIEAPVAIEQPATPSPAPASPAIAYKAVGTEPGWALKINGATTVYEGDYGSVTISEATPAGFRPAPGRYAGARLKLTITPGPCSDGMSDLTYRHKVRLMADGKAITGCGGGTVQQVGLASTNWTVIAINGRATPGGAGYFLNFTLDTLSAKFGCNGMGGGWRLNGDHLSTGDLSQTLIGCPEPSATFERLGNAVLRSNMRLERTGGETMRLVSEAGSIDLKRSN